MDTIVIVEAQVTGPARGLHRLLNQYSKIPSLKEDSNFADSIVADE